ncbi:thiaminase II [Primorskyibacter sp. S87]|uniref:thiaminase II n=1 Tax=Primorskyibacter sp. S87 TaxID=3415126 RepID=UPI003C79CCD7
MSATDYGRAFGLLRDAAGQSWRDYTRHAFVQGLSDGGLSREAFLHYLRQDYVFLIHFARAWALAVTKSETPQEMATAAATVDALVNHELQLHVSICAEAGISEADLFATPERAGNLAYTRYVLESGYSGDLLDLLAALAPCVMGYGEIGTRLAQEASSETYRAWIETYAGEDYQQSCIAVGELLDDALERRLGADYASLPRWQSLCDRFATATRLEVGFWDMGLTP